MTIGAKNYSYIVESPEVIAARLAADINANGNLVRATLVVTAAPVTGEVWAVTVNIGGVVAQAGYAALAGDSLADVMAGLAKALNALGGLPFTARADDATANADDASLMLVNGTAALPTVTFKRGITALTPTVDTEANFVASSEGSTLVIVPLTGAFPSAAGTASVAARNSLTAASATVALVTPTAARRRRGRARAQTGPSSRANHGPDAQDRRCRWHRGVAVQPHGAAREQRDRERRGDLRPGRWSTASIPEQCLSTPPSPPATSSLSRAPTTPFSPPRSSAWPRLPASLPTA
ncbi:MAG: hypothetical protein IPK39_05805 [Sulfuritalea sp.]|nr:hypothetical protein [Sulfuritalea sp.]